MNFFDLKSIFFVFYVDFNLDFRYKDQSSFKLAALQKQISESVPATHLESANRQFSDLTAKYRDLLQKEQLHSVQVGFVGFELRPQFDSTSAQL